MPTAIPGELQDFIEREIASGKFRSEEEVVSTALRLLREREQRHDALRSDLQEGAADLDSGGRLTAEDVFRRLRERAAELEEQS
jgi:putative addiction module CopG family antidote